MCLLKGGLLARDQAAPVPYHAMPSPLLAFASHAQPPPARSCGLSNARPCASRRRCPTVAHLLLQGLVFDTLSGPRESGQKGRRSRRREARRWSQYQQRRQGEEVGWPTCSEKPMAAATKLCRRPRCKLSLQHRAPLRDWLERAGELSPAPGRARLPEASARIAERVPRQAQHCG